MKITSTLKYFSVVAALMTFNVHAQDQTNQSLSDTLRQGAAAIISGQEGAAGASRMTAEQAISSWNVKPKQTAQEMITKYGQPNEITSQRLVWNNNGPWKRTVIVNEEIPHNFPVPHTDFMEQTIDMRVPPEKFSDLAKYDGSIIVERTKGEISARCDKEQHNILALNLAKDIISGSKSVEQARQSFASTINAEMKGTTPETTQKLQFAVAKGGTMDPDTSEAITEPSGGQPTVPAQPGESPEFPAEPQSGQPNP